MKFVVWSMLIVMSISMASAAIVEKNVRLWKNCRDSSRDKCAIRMKFDENIPNYLQTRDEVREFLKIVLKYANIRIIITKKDNYDILVKKVPTLSHANVGDLRRKTTLGLSEGYFSTGWAGSYEQKRSTFLHEFMHVLGFTHEHSHFKRTIDFSDYNLNQYCSSWSGDKYDVDYCKQNMSKMIFPDKAKYLRDTYDFDSITHYDFPSHYRDSQNNLHEYSWGPDYEFKHRTTLSFNDKLALVRLYPGRVENEEQVIDMHLADIDKEEKRIEAAKYYLGCRVDFIKNRTNTCHWTIYKGDEVIPEFKGSCYGEKDIFSAINVMKRSASCQGS